MKKVLKYIKDKTIFLSAITLAAVVGGASTAVVLAAIPDGNGQLQACYRNTAGLLDPKGNLRIIDTSSESCTGQETAVSWDQNNPPQGSQFGDLVSLTGKTTSGTDFMFLNMANQNFTGTNFDGSSLSYSNFTNSNFTNAILNSRPAENADFTGAIFTGANIDESVIMDGSNFTNANISGLTIGFTVNNANFSGTNMSNITFDSANLLGSSMATATLTGATWSNTTCPDGTNSDNNGNTCIGHLTP